MGAPKVEYSAGTFHVELRLDDFKYFSKKIYELAGIHLPPTPKNTSLLQNRLSRLLRRYKLATFSDLVQFIENANETHLEEFISTLTTNKTHFFREAAHFSFLKTELSHHFSQHNELRIWCAACSTGQEPYSLGIVLSEALSNTQISRSKILATDIDLEILNRARCGEYTETEMEGLSSDLKRKYFSKEAQAEKFAVIKSLRALIDFARFNLISGRYKFTKPFDFIFCRNVLIYFDPPTSKRVIENLSTCLRPGGVLFLGHSESGTQIDAPLSSVAQAVYRKD